MPVVVWEKAPARNARRVAGGHAKASKASKAAASYVRKTSKLRYKKR